MEALSIVAFLVIERECNGELERAQGRNPGNAEARRIAQVSKVDLLTSVVAVLITFVTSRVAGIQEAEDSQRAVAARERSKDFDIAGNHAVTAKIVAVRIG